MVVHILLIPEQQGFLCTYPATHLRPFIALSPTQGVNWKGCPSSRRLWAVREGARVREVLESRVRGEEKLC